MTLAVLQDDLALGLTTVVWSFVDSAVAVTNLAFPDADHANTLDDLAVLQDDLAFRPSVVTWAVAESAVLDANVALPTTIVAWSGVDSAVLGAKFALPQRSWRGRPSTAQSWIRTWRSPAQTFRTAAGLPRCALVLSRVCTPPPLKTIRASRNPRPCPLMSSG
jgi:hypothetical protein